MTLDLRVNGWYGMMRSLNRLFLANRKRKQDFGRAGGSRREAEHPHSFGNERFNTPAWPLLREVAT